MGVDFLGIFFYNLLSCRGRVFLKDVIFYWSILGFVGGWGLAGEIGRGVSIVYGLIFFCIF